MQVLEAASRGYLQRLHDPKRGESRKAKREEYVERKLAAVIVQGHMRKRLAADEWQTRRSAAAHMQACYRGRRDRETVATHQEGRNELKAASEAAAAAERAAKEAERAAKEAAAQARCNIVSDLDAENAAEHAMVAKAAATAAATHLTEVEAKLAAASSGDGGGGGAGLKLAPATIERVPRLFFKPLRTLGAMGSAGEFSLLSSYSRCGSLLVAAAPHTLIIEINGARYRSNALSAARSMVERRVMIFASVPAFRALAPAEEGAVPGGRASPSFAEPSMAPSPAPSPLRDLAYLVKTTRVGRGEMIELPGPNELLVVEEGEVLLTLPDRRWAPSRAIASLGIGTVLSQRGGVGAGAGAGGRSSPTPAAAAVLRGTPTTLLHIDRKLAISLLGTGAIEGAERDAALALSALTAVSDRASEARVKAHEALIAAIAEGQQDRRRHQQQGAPQWRAPPALLLQSAPPYPQHTQSPSASRPGSPPPPPTWGSSGGDASHGRHGGRLSSARLAAPTTRHRAAPAHHGAMVGAEGAVQPGLRVELNPRPNVPGGLPACSAAAAAAAAAAGPSAYGQGGGNLTEMSEAWQRAAEEGQWLSGSLLAQGKELLLEVTSQIRQERHSTCETSKTGVLSDVTTWQSFPNATSGEASHRYEAPYGPFVASSVAPTWGASSGSAQPRAYNSPLRPSSAPHFRAAAYSTAALNAAAAAYATSSAHAAAVRAAVGAAVSGDGTAAVPSEPRDERCHRDGRTMPRSASAALIFDPNLGRCVIFDGGGGAGAPLQRPASAQQLGPTSMVASSQIRVAPSQGSQRAHEQRQEQQGLRRQAPSLLVSSFNQPPSSARKAPSTQFNDRGFLFGSTMHQGAMRKAPAHQREPMGLGVDVLGPLRLSAPVDEVLVARPRSERADREAREARAARPRDSLQREPKGGELWMRREERVASILRTHVSAMNAVTGGSSKSALLARRKAAAAHYSK
jgi:hypothetical protein